LAFGACRCCLKRLILGSFEKAGLALRGPALLVLVDAVPSGLALAECAAIYYKRDPRVSMSCCGSSKSSVRSMAGICIVM